MKKSLTSFPIQVLKNPRARRRAAYPSEFKDILSLEAHATAAGEMRSWPGYAATPLIPLPGLAAAAGLEAIAYKDESERFGLNSFKALGGAYAVFRLLAAEVQRRTNQKEVSAADLVGGRYKDVVSEVVVTCATDGNHGRAVAWGAALFGCGCVIYIHQHVSSAREEAIAAWGAEVVRAGATYDESVQAAAVEAERRGRLVVSDTSYPGYVDLPRLVMQGYTVMTEEASAALARPPSHVFIQGGVGGLAASVCAHLWEKLGLERPLLVVVEPEAAACLFASAAAGRSTAVKGDLRTIMSMLACGEASLLAWKILSCGADFFMTIPDRAAVETMRLLARSPFGDRPVVGGESGVAGLAGLLAAASDPQARQRLGLTGRTRALVIGTEGATDPQTYLRLVGLRPAAVLAREAD